MNCLTCNHPVSDHADTADASCKPGCLCPGLHLDVGDCTKECYEQAN